jgi:hypothetical protein
VSPHRRGDACPGGLSRWWLTPAVPITAPNSDADVRPFTTPEPYRAAHRPEPWRRRGGVPAGSARTNRCAARSRCTSQTAEFVVRRLPPKQSSHSRRPRRAPEERQCSGVSRDISRPRPFGPDGRPHPTSGRAPPTTSAMDLQVPRPPIIRLMWSSARPPRDAPHRTQPGRDSGASAYPVSPLPRCAVGAVPAGCCPRRPECTLALRRRNLDVL